MLTTTRSDDGPALAAEDHGPFDPGPSDQVEQPVEGEPAVAALVAAVVAMDRAAAQAVAAARELDVARVIAEEGMDHEAALRLHTRATRGDVAVVLEAARVLGHMPATAGLFADGVLSWGHIRALTVGTRTLSIERRAELDGHLAAHADQLARLDGDGRLGAIDDAIDRHTPAELLTDRHDRDLEARRLLLCPRLDGSGTLFGDLDAEGFAAVTGRLEAETRPPLAEPAPGDDTTGMPRRHAQGDTAGGRARLLADALVRLCESGPTGRTGGRTGTPVRFTLLVDTDQVGDSVAATIQTALATRPARVTRRTRDRLACDGATDLIVQEGGQLVATHRGRPDVTAATRRAVGARDQGCRFPSCRAPVNWCDIHHVVPRAAGGTHDPANLVLLCRRHHTAIHRRGWTQSTTPDGGYRITRRGRTWTTWPRDHQLPPPHAHPPGADRPDGAPPAGEPPDTGGGPDPGRHATGTPAPSTCPPEPDPPEPDPSEPDPPEPDPPEPDPPEPDVPHPRRPRSSHEPDPPLPF